MICNNFSLDDIDKQIVEIVQKEPTLTHTMIAKKVHRSQPTIGHRIKRLEDSGLLQYQAGLNLKKLDFYYARVVIQTKDSISLIQIINECPHMIFALKLSGIDNFEIIIASQNLKQLDQIVNIHFRNNPDILNVSMEIIVDVFNDLILPFDLRDKECECDQLFQDTNLKNYNSDKFDI